MRHAGITPKGYAAPYGIWSKQYPALDTYPLCIAQNLRMDMIAYPIRYKLQYPAVMIQ